MLAGGGGVRSAHCGYFRERCKLTLQLAPPPSFNAITLRRPEACFPTARAGDQKACIEHFAASVQHDSPLHIHPRQDPPFYSFLLTALSAVGSAGIPPAAAAAATAFLCVSDPQALGLSQQQAGERLDALAAQHRDLRWVQYAAATSNVLRGNHRQAAEALTRAILAGGSCGMYYNRARWAGGCGGGEVGGWGVGVRAWQLQGKLCRAGFGSC